MAVRPAGRTYLEVEVLYQPGKGNGYVFGNRRANRMKVLVHDGIGVWHAARRLNAGRLPTHSKAGSTSCCRTAGQREADCVAANPIPGVRGWESVPAPGLQPSGQPCLDKRKP